MSQRTAASFLVAFLVLLLGLGAWLLHRGQDEAPSGTPGDPAVVAGAPGAVSAAPSAQTAPGAGDETGPATRTASRDPAGGGATVRGRVLDAKTARPLPGVEVVAMKRLPGFERLESRFRGLFRTGLWTDPHEPVVVLGSAVSDGEGRFEIRGLPEGQLFLDGRSDRVYVRTPGMVRLARTEVREGVELLGLPGGRIRGQVFGPDGLPASGAEVSVRPGLNAFLGQVTQRRYRWLETRTDADGRFDLRGVPTGSGYTLSATAKIMALEEVHGVEVREGQTTDVVVRGLAGGLVLGKVVDGEGRPVAKANVAMVYLDVSRVLFSADGRTEPITTDADGTFRLERVAPGRIALAAAADGLAPSAIQELAVVDGGTYDDLTFELGEGRAFGGLVVDDQDRPLPDVDVEVRPFEQPNDPDVLKFALRIRSVKTRSGPDGRFAFRGLSGRDLFLQASRPGYVTLLRFNVKLDDKDVKLQLVRGVTVRGKVALPDGAPATRFRVEARSREARPQGAESRPDRGALAEAQGNDRRGDRRGPPWAQGGRRGGAAQIQLREGQAMMDRGLEGDWEEIESPDGSFTVKGIPPGRVRVRVRAEGYLDPETRDVDLAAGATSEVLEFTLRPGAVARGTVVDAASNQPVSDAQVTAYRANTEREARDRDALPFRISADPEDLDFLGLAAMGARRSVLTDSQGRFEVKGLAGGTYRFTARHPDLAKASAKDVEVLVDRPTEGVVIQLGGGGTVEGVVTGAGRRPLADALIVVGSLQAGSLKSVSTDAQGFYRLTGLPGGLYIVFKSRMDERAMNLGYDLLGNMRLKTVTVREGKVTRFDIADESDDGVRVFGVVTDAGQPVARAMVTALNSDREGVLGLGIRARPTDEKGAYELIGLKPGTYFFQVSRFRGRPEQASLSITVPEGVKEHRLDLDLPQSTIAGVVRSRDGAPIPGVLVQAGVVGGEAAAPDGLLGLILQNGANQARTDQEGRFTMRSVAKGTYRVTASGRGMRATGVRYGEVAVEGVVVDGRTAVEGLDLLLPAAGTITGTVVDGNGAPVANAEVLSLRDGGPRRDQASPLGDLFGLQERPARTGPDGRFKIEGVTPGRYRVRADVEGLSPGVADEVVVAESAATDVTIQVVRGATLRLRVTNVDGSFVPLAQVSLLDGRGKPLASRVSVLSVFRRFVAADEKKEDTGWREIGGIPPDTYTLIVKEPGKEEVRFTRTVNDGEKVEWEIDMMAELRKAGRAR